MKRPALIVAIWAAALCVASFVGGCALVGSLRRSRGATHWVARSRYKEGQS